MTRRSPFAIWTAPVLIALASLLGLGAALVGDGGADALSWAALAVPLAVTAWALAARRR